MTHSTLALLGTRLPQNAVRPNRKPSDSFSRRWDLDWSRVSHLGDNAISRNEPTTTEHRFHDPGSIDGTWQGIFTYTEFGVYAAIFSGESPNILQDGAIGQNQQTWRIREYNLFLKDKRDILRVGKPNYAFFMEQTMIKEEDDHGVFNLNGEEWRYHRARRGSEIDRKDGLKDVILLGEGHSTWGDFKLRGRVRAGDGFVTMLKQYDGPDDRGRWLYRGYLFGGKLVGRWRDSTTPFDTVGYEGGFEMSLRG